MTRGKDVQLPEDTHCLDAECAYRVDTTDCPVPGTTVLVLQLPSSESTPRYVFETLFTNDYE